MKLYQISISIFVVSVLCVNSIHAADKMSNTQKNTTQVEETQTKLISKEVSINRPKLEKNQSAGKQYKIKLPASHTSAPVKSTGIPDKILPRRKPLSQQNVPTLITPNIDNREPIHGELGRILERPELGPRDINSRLGDVKTLPNAPSTAAARDAIENQLKILSVIGQKLRSSARDGFVELRVSNPSTTPREVIAAVWNQDGSMRLQTGDRVSIAADGFKIIRLNRVALAANEVVCTSGAECSATLTVGLLNARSGNTAIAKKHTFVIQPDAIQVEVKLAQVSTLDAECTPNNWEISHRARVPSVVSFDGNGESIFSSTGSRILWSPSPNTTLVAEIDPAAEIELGLSATVRGQGKASITRSSRGHLIPSSSWRTQDRLSLNYLTDGNCMAAVIARYTITRTAVLR